MQRLDPHPDVIPAIGALRAAGFRTATLTNGSTEAAAAQLDHAGLKPVLDDTMTVDAVRRFKPAREVRPTVSGKLRRTVRQVRSPESIKPSRYQKVFVGSPDDIGSATVFPLAHSLTDGGLGGSECPHNCIAGRLSTEIR